jgi:hypothetical protein
MVDYQNQMPQAPPGLMNYLMQQSQDQAPPPPPGEQPSMMPQPGDKRSGLMSMLPALISSLAGAIGGPNSSIGNAGAGFTHGYVDQLIKQQDIERQKKSAFEGMMQKTAWDAFKELDGVDLNELNDVPPLIRHQIMEYSQKFKEALADDNYINPKEAQMLTALHAGIAPYIRKAKEEQEATGKGQQAAMQQHAGMMQALASQYPSGPPQTNDRSFSQMISQHPDIQPAMDMVGGMDFGDVGNVGPGHLQGLREKLASSIEQQQSQQALDKGALTYVPGPNGQMIPIRTADYVRSQDKGEDRASRERMNQARVNASIQNTRERIKGALQRMGGRFDIATARMVEQRLMAARTEALQRSDPDDPASFDLNLIDAVNKMPALTLPGGQQVPMSQLVQSKGQSLAEPPFSEQEKQALANKIAAATKAGKTPLLTPREKAMRQAVLGGQ